MTVSTKQFARTLAKCAPLFHALGEPARQKIVMVLAEASELNVGEVARRVELSRPAISHHLKVLRLAGFVRMRKAGTENFYALQARDPLTLLRRFVDEADACC